MGYRSLFVAAMGGAALLASAGAEAAPSFLKVGEVGDGLSCRTTRGVQVCSMARPSAPASAPEISGLAGAPATRAPAKPEIIIREKTIVVTDRANRVCRRAEDVIPGVGCRRTRRFTRGFFADRIARGH